jgi:hypothetical protein
LAARGGTVPRWNVEANGIAAQQHSGHRPIIKGDNMFSKLLDRIALVIAARVAEEVVKQMPSITDHISAQAGGVAQRIIDDITSKFNPKPKAR